MDIFHQRQDYATFLTYLEGAVADQAVDVHAFALMTNHVHLIATPGAARAISLVMKTLGEQYVRYYNRQYDRIGTLWNQRYGAKPIEDERYWLTCLRYVEQNPVRAGIIDRPEAYEWSSYAAHAFGRWPEWLTPHPVYLALGKTDEERQLAYRSLCGTLLDDGELARLRTTIRSRPKVEASLLKQSDPSPSPV